MRYVALGDSYTIGTSVAEAERWPNQLVERNRDIELVANLAVNGFTSQDVIAQELPQLDDLQPELVSLLIGVNDVVQGVADSEYAGNATVILEDLLNRVARDRVFCVATPDYTVTPRGDAFGDPIQQSDAIVRVNAIMKEACDARAICFVPDIFEISQAARHEPALIADDGLHPSARQYARWLQAIGPAVDDLLNS